MLQDRNRETQTLPSKTQFSSLCCASARYPKVHFFSHSTVRYYICNTGAMWYATILVGHLTLFQYPYQVPSTPTQTPLTQVSSRI